VGRNAHPPLFVAKQNGKEGFLATNKMPAHRVRQHGFRPEAIGRGATLSAISLQVAFKMSLRHSDVQGKSVSRWGGLADPVRRCRLKDIHHRALRVIHFPTNPRCRPDEVYFYTSNLELFSRLKSIATKEDFPEVIVGDFAWIEVGEKEPLFQEIKTLLADAGVELQHEYLTRETVGKRCPIWLDAPLTRKEMD
jgi:hypothetical protein